MSSLIIAIIAEIKEITFPIALANAFTAKLYIIHIIIIITVIPLYFFKLFCHTEYVVKIDNRIGSILINPLNVNIPETRTIIT